MVTKAESVPRCEIIDWKYTAQHALGAPSGLRAERLCTQCVPSRLGT